ncbi:MAG: NGG1p interacting factor NIF3 [bacterium]|nr:NGG1p interacting factor NIF3 [bacterium]
MTVKELFALATKIGMAADPRGEAGVKRSLARVKKHYDGLGEKEKKFFDTDKLTNPYPDGGIHVDDGKTQVKRVLAGIDINGPEILLASQLNERGKKIDVVIAHHPEGKGLSNLHEVMEMYTDVYSEHGVPVHIAEKLTEMRIGEIGRGTHPINHFQAVDIARNLGINFINTHTITDNLVDKFVREFLTKKKPETVGEIIECLMELPEYQEAKKNGAGPKIIAGSANHRVGKMMLEMTGGTNPSPKVYEQFSQYGVSTIVGMHMRDDAMKNASEVHMNIIIAGHMPSDSLGMNLFLDELEKRGIEIVACGGLIRVSRNKKTK